MNVHDYLQTPLDYYSILEKLGEIEFKYCESDHDEYYSDYEDMFTDLANSAAYIYEDIERFLRNTLWNYPTRSRGNTEIFWFDTAAALIDESDVMLLLENEGVFPSDDEDTERDKRIRAIQSLTKKQAFELMRGVFNLLMSYLKVLQAYEMLCGMVDELRRLHSFRERDGVSLLPPTAYVE